MKFFVLPITKNPAFGRVGQEELQDWYRGCARAVQIQRGLSSAGHDAEIVVLSDVHIKGYRHEAEYYQDALKKLGAKNVRTIQQGQETVGQIEIILEIAKKEDAKLVVVSTFGHYLRLAWLLRGTDAQHETVFGLPRFRELITDGILTVLFPLIDLTVGREWFQNKVVHRRESGKH